jgi:hypothetical protein
MSENPLGGFLPLGKPSLPEGYERCKECGSWLFVGKRKRASREPVLPFVGLLIVLAVLSVMVVWLSTLHVLSTG